MYNIDTITYIYNIFKSIALQCSLHEYFGVTCRLCSEAFSYYLSLSNDGHRDAWRDLMLLMFSRLLKLSNQEVTWPFLYVLISLTLFSA